MCGYLPPASYRATLSSTDRDRELTDVDPEEAIALKYNEIYGDTTGNIFEEASSPTTEQENEDNDKTENNYSPTFSNDSSLDQDTTLWSITTASWSPTTLGSSPSTHIRHLVPLPEPNTLTSTYLPFSIHLALTNHLTSSTLTHFRLSQSPIFIHGMLQLPCTLSTLLGLPTSDLLCRLTPAILLNHTTYLDATTLLPSLAKSTVQSTYHHVHGLLYFPKTSACVEKLNDLFSTQKPRLEMKKVIAQIQDSTGKRHDLVAWAWVARTAEGTEEWWTCEDFVAGRVVGLQNVKW